MNSIFVCSKIRSNDAAYGFCIHVSCIIAIACTIWPTLDGDFVNILSGLITFTPALSRVCSDIFIIEDSILEDDENFTVALNATEDQVTTGSAAIVVIEDDDGKNNYKTVGF